MDLSEEIKSIIKGFTVLPILYIENRIQNLNSTLYKYKAVLLLKVCNLIFI